MRTTVDIDAHLLKRLRAEAHRRGASFKEFLEGVIRRGLDQTTESNPSRYRTPTFAMGTPRSSSLTLDKALALAAAMEDEEIARELGARK